LSCRPRTRILLLVSTLLLGALTACSSGSQRSGAPTPAEVEALLARHASALLAHSSARFLADVDSSAKSKAFRTRQAAEIDNISDVPLQTWRYTATGTDTDRAELAAAARRYGAPALIVQVRLSYRLRGIDALPDQHDLWWTFVRRGGHVYLAGDDDLAKAGSASWRGPWDFGPVVVARGASSLVLGHVADALQLTPLADAVDAAIPAVDAVWGSDWTQHVAVLVPSGEKEFSALTGSGTGYRDIAAVAITAGTDAVAGRPYGQRLVMDPAALATLSKSGRQIVVRHELTHLATAAATSRTTPRWLVEGFAEFVAERGSGQPVPTAAAELRAQVARGALPSALPADPAFNAGSANSAGLAAVYEQSWLACRLIAQRAGVGGLVRFYREVGRAVLPAAYAVRLALRDVLHETLAAFTAQWRAYLTAQLGGP
jgi:hypothetical protein